MIIIAAKRLTCSSLQNLTRAKNLTLPPWASAQQLSAISGRKGSISLLKRIAPRATLQEGYALAHRLRQRLCSRAFRRYCASRTKVKRSRRRSARAALFGDPTRQLTSGVGTEQGFSGAQTLLQRLVMLSVA